MRHQTARQTFALQDPQAAEPFQPFPAQAENRSARTEGKGQGYPLGCPLHTEIGGFRWDPPGGFGMGCSACFQPVRLVFGLFRADFNDCEPQIDKNPSNFDPLWPLLGSLAFGVRWAAWIIAL